MIAPPNAPKGIFEELRTLGDALIPAGTDDWTKQDFQEALIPFAPTPAEARAMKGDVLKTSNSKLAEILRKLPEHMQDPMIRKLQEFGLTYDDIFGDDSDEPAAEDVSCADFFRRPEIFRP